MPGLQVLSLPPRAKKALVFAAVLLVLDNFVFPGELSSTSSSQFTRLGPSSSIISFVKNIILALPLQFVYFFSRFVLVPLLIYCKYCIFVCSFVLIPLFLPFTYWYYGYRPSYKNNKQPYRGININVRALRSGDWSSTPMCMQLGDNGSNIFMNIFNANFCSLLVLFCNKCSLFGTKSSRLSSLNFKIRSRLNQSQ